VETRWGEKGYPFYGKEEILKINFSSLKKDLKRQNTHSRKGRKATSRSWDRSKKAKRLRPFSKVESKKLAQGAFKGGFKDTTLRGNEKREMPERGNRARGRKVGSFPAIRVDHTENGFKKRRKRRREQRCHAS